MSDKTQEYIEKDNIVMVAIISIAMKNGWTPIGAVGDNFQWSYLLGTFHMKTPIWDGEKMVQKMHSCSFEKVLFDHEFAKCLWGEESISNGADYSEPKYKIELKNLAVAEDRVEFLEQFIPHV